MVGSRRGQAIPTQLDFGVFEQFVLPHLSTGSRGPAPKLSLFKIFNYILQRLYLGVSVEGATNRKEQRRLSRNPLYPHLSCLPTMGGRWLRVGARIDRRLCYCCSRL